MKYLKKTFQIVLVAGAIGGCSSHTPIYNVQEHPFSMDAKRLTNKEIGSTIINTASKRGWTCSQHSESKLVCLLQRRKHAATIEIDYNQSSFSIKNIKTANLNEKDGQIHPKYNKWVKLLKTEIEVAVNLKAVER